MAKLVVFHNLMQKTFESEVSSVADMREAYNWLLDHGRETAYLDSMRSLLAWDQRTFIPPRGHGHRAAQFAVLAKLIHSRMTDPKIGEMLAAVEGSELVSDRLSPEAVNVREWRRDYDRAVKIPEKLAVALARAASEGETVWEKARPANDWASFKPCLERLVALKREEADALGYEREAYDALLDEYEPGEKTANLELLFAGLRAPLVDLLDRIRGASRRPDTSVLHRRFPRAAQEAFSRETAVMIGYDPEAGRLDPTAHPFTVGIGPGDVRITTKYDESFFNPAFFGTIHELGHALYDLGIPADAWGTPLGRAVSLGIHESQSRTWENMVCRSRGFWRHWYPRARESFDALADVDMEDFLFAVNEVSPSLIRIEADEVTYNLHILLRFELELGLLRGHLQVDDLPGAWNEKMAAYVGISPNNYADGVMQDIHWAGGAIGYFPTYTLGNLYAAQFFATAQRDLGDLEEQFARGEFRAFRDWLRDKIHSQGSRYLPRDLARTVTGEELDPGHFIGYLQRKFGDLYNTVTG